MSHNTKRKNSHKHRKNLLKREKLRKNRLALKPIATKMVEYLQRKREEYYLMRLFMPIDPLPDDIVLTYKG